MRIAYKIIRISFTSILSLILLINLYLMIVRSFGFDNMPTLFGYANAIVITGSMSGAIEINDMVVTHHQSSYKKGDIITYQSGKSTVTHRIIEVVDRGYITQGDANNVADPEIIQSQVIGKVVLIVPQFGVLTQAMYSPLGMIVIVTIGGLWIIGPQEAARLLSRRKRKGVVEDEKIQSSYN